MITVAWALIPQSAAWAQVYTSDPTVFSLATWDRRGKGVRLTPTDGSSTTPLLVIFVPLTELAPGAGPGSVGYSGYDDAWFVTKVFGGTALDAQVPANFVELASLGLFHWIPAAESAGTPDDGIVILPAQDPATLSSGCRVAYDALSLADPFVDFTVFDTTGDGSIDARELSVLVLVGTGSGGGQACHVNQDRDPADYLELDGLSTSGLWGARAGGPNLADTANTPDMIHELFHARFDHVDLYGTGIGAAGIMGTTGGVTQPQGPSALTRLLLDWSIPTVATNDGWYELERADRTGDMLIVYDPDRGTDEYYLLENRVVDTDPLSVDRGIPDSGVFAQAIDVTQWRGADTSTTKEMPTFLRFEQPNGLRAAPGCRYYANLTTSSLAGQQTLVVDSTGFPTPPFPVRIANAGELDEIANVTAITGNTLNLQSPLLFPHGAGANVLWRNIGWTGYFAGLLSTDAVSGTSTFQVSLPMWGTLPVGTGGTVLPNTRVRLFTDSGNPYLAEDPDTYQLMAVSSDATSWTVSPTLTDDYPTATRMSEGYRDNCRGLGGRSAWDTADVFTPPPGRSLNRLNMLWNDGSDTGFRMLGVGPAAEITRLYIDLPGRNGLFNLPPTVISPPSASTLPFEAEWETEFTGDGSPTVLLEVTESGGSSWLSTSGTPTATSPWMTQSLTHTGVPPEGLSVDYTLTVPSNSIFDEAGTIPVDWPFLGQGVLNLVGWSSEGAPLVPAGFGPGRPWVLVNRSLPMRFGTTASTHTNDLLMPGLLEGLLPAGFPGFPACGETSAARFEDPAGNEHKIMAETILRVAIEPNYSFENREDVLSVTDAVPASDGGYPLSTEIVCPVESESHQIQLVPLSSPRLQRYEYEVALRQSTNFFTEPVGGLGDTLRLNGTPARSVPCEGGFFPRCRTNPFGEVFLVLPPALKDFGPPGCPAGCPNHYVTVMSDAFPYLDLNLSVPTGTVAELLDGFGNVVSSAFVVVQHTEPGLLPSASYDTETITHKHQETRPDTARHGLAIADTSDYPMVALNTAKVGVPVDNMPPSPFVRNTPVEAPVHDELRLIHQGAPGTYYLRLTLPVGFDATLEPEPLSVSYTTFDQDADGFQDNEDNCPVTPQIDQADADQDGVGDACDNCVQLPNFDQADLDGDLIGDVCDDDRDGDDLLNTIEINVGTDPDKADTDGDGLNDGDEINQYGTEPLDGDTDNDGIDDGTEVALGTNPNAAETCDVDTTPGFSVGDLLLLQKHLLGIENLDVDQAGACDMNHDGQLTVADFLKLLQDLL